MQILDLWKNYQMPDRVLRDSREEFFHKRYRQIRQFEEYLYENGYRVVKIFLHVSKEEQGKRFLERIEEPEKNWKFSSSDLETRERFEEYTDLYEEVIRETASDPCPLVCPARRPEVVHPLPGQRGSWWICSGSAIPGIPSSRKPNAPVWLRPGKFSSGNRTRKTDPLRRRVSPSGALRFFVSVPGELTVFL